MNTNQRRVLKELMNLENRTISQVAKSAGVTRPTVYSYLGDPAFRKALQEAQGHEVEIASSQLSKLLAVAVQGLGSVLSNPTQEGANTRRLASKDILEILIKMRTIALEERIAAIEAKLEEM